MVDSFSFRLRFVIEEILPVAGHLPRWSSRLDKDTRQLISALERNKIRSLQRPIEAGTGPGGFVIGD